MLLQISDEKSTSSGSLMTRYLVPTTSKRKIAFNENHRLDRLRVASNRLITNTYIAKDAASVRYRAPLSALSTPSVSTISSFLMDT